MSEFVTMEELLDQNGIPYEEDETEDYAKMFQVIEELCDGKLEFPEIVAGFAALTGVMEEEGLVTGRQKMMAMYNQLEELPKTQGKLDNKEKLFFAFSVYAACNIISENDDKKHHYMGLPEFESPEYIKYKMEEYWAMDPYMFYFAVQK